MFDRVSQSIWETDYLTWESCNDPRFDFDCPPPTPIANHLPEWVKNMRGNIREYFPEGFGMDRTIRHCAGFQGLLNIGYSIPLPVEVGGWQTHFASGNLHPEMVHGTPWAEKPGGPWNDASDVHNGKDWSPYKYRLKLLFWPWRARMAPGWRMMIVPNLWEWHTEWQAFSGAPKSNYHVNPEGTGLGSHSNWDIPLDTNYNYYNLETVLAVHREHVIPAGTVTFWLIPIYEP